VLVHSDGHPDVVLAKSDGVSSHLQDGCPSGAPIEDVCEWEAGHSEQSHYRIREIDLVAPTESELDVGPGDPGISTRGSDCLGSHFDCRFLSMPAEWMNPDSDDCDVIHGAYSSHRRKREHHHLGAVSVDPEGNYHQFNVHTEAEARRVARR
jgi:hypothetical protein